MKIIRNCFKIRILMIFCMILAVFGLFMACEDLSVQNQSVQNQEENYRVTFQANGGSPMPDVQTVKRGNKVKDPGIIIKNGYSFGGWYKDNTWIDSWDFNNDIARKDIILYAEWLENFTVTFDTNGGNPESVLQSFAFGRKINKPADIIKDGLFLVGWYKEQELVNEWNFNNDFIFNDMTLYAKWEPAVYITGTTLFEKLQWLSSNAVSNTNYIIEVNNVEHAPSQTFSLNGRENISIRFISNNYGIIFFSPGGPFRIDNGVTLIVDNVIFSRFHGEPIIFVNKKGNLILNQGSKITGNNHVSGSIPNSSGGINVQGGTVIMNGGEISDFNSYGYGGAINIGNNGEFTMNDGVISGNVSRSGSGGAIYMRNGIFTMNGGKITENIVQVDFGLYNRQAIYYGGAICIDSGIFTMNDGVISNNHSLSHYSSGYFSYGGGVYVSGTFIMNGGEISGNTTNSKSYSYGGGVHVNKGVFTMNGGEISGNTTTSSSFYYPYGGGVYLCKYSKFEKTGGVIHGYSMDYKSNIVKGNGIIGSNNGHAVYVENGTLSEGRKETTAGENDDLIYIPNDPNELYFYGAWDN